MKTRFDGKLWIGAFGLAIEVKDMETAHLLNTVKMLVQKPARVQAMLVNDIEDATFEEQEAWTPTGNGEDIRKKSLHNATSLSSEELVQYVTGTPLFKAMMEELEARGVNTENIMELYEMARDPKTDGGVDTLYTRQRKVFSPFGISYEKTSQTTLSPTDAELANGANWCLVHSGESDEGDRSYIAHKAIPIARILSRG